jgi:4a-hydroxytetrahydrobiopterin dehydratase
MNTEPHPIAPACSLSDRTCEPCKGGTPPLAGDELDRYRTDLGSTWMVVEGHDLEKSFTFRNFRDAMAFAVAIGELAEQQGHHPNLHVAWGLVRVVLWTHKIGGLSPSDFILAAKIDALPRPMHAP